MANVRARPDDLGRNTALALDMAAGAVTGMLSKTAVAPIERTKVLLQLQV